MCSKSTHEAADELALNPAGEDARGWLASSHTAPHVPPAWHLLAPRQSPNKYQMHDVSPASWPLWLPISLTERCPAAPASLPDALFLPIIGPAVPVSLSASASGPHSREGAVFPEQSGHPTASGIRRITAQRAEEVRAERPCWGRQGQSQRALD